MSEVKKKVSEEILNELTGRMYECCELQMAIDDGLFSSLAELSTHLKKESCRLDRTIKAGAAGEPGSMPFRVELDFKAGGWLRRWRGGRLERMGRPADA